MFNNLKPNFMKTKKLIIAILFLIGSGLFAITKAQCFTVNNNSIDCSFYVELYDGVTLVASTTMTPSTAWTPTIPSCNVTDVFVYHNTSAWNGPDAHVNSGTTTDVVGNCQYQGVSTVRWTSASQADIE